MISLHNGTLNPRSPLAVGSGNLTGWGTVGGDVTLSSSAAPSTLAFNLGGEVQGTQYDSLTIIGNMSLGGNLALTLTNGFAPLPGDTFTVLAATSLSGAFLNVFDGSRLEDTNGNGSFLVQYGSGANVNQIVLTGFQAVPDPTSLATLAVGASVLTMRRRRKA